MVLLLIVRLPLISLLRPDTQRDRRPNQTNEVNWSWSSWGSKAGILPGTMECPEPAPSALIRPLSIVYRPSGVGGNCIGSTADQWVQIGRRWVAWGGAPLPVGDTAKDFLILVRPSNGDCNVLMQERWTNPVVDFVRYHLVDIRLFDVLWQRGLRMAGLAGMGKGQRGISTVDP